MSTEEKLMLLFTEVHGEISGSLGTEIFYDEEYEPVAVRVVKGGNVCWQATKLDLLFDYITEQIQNQKEKNYEQQ